MLQCATHHTKIVLPAFSHNCSYTIWDTGLLYTYIYIYIFFNSLLTSSHTHSSRKHLLTYPNYNLPPPTCGILPSPAPPPTATMGSPVCAETNSSMGAKGPQAVRGGLSSS